MPPNRDHPSRANRGAKNMEPQMPQGTVDAAEVANMVAQAVNVSIAMMARQPIALIA